MHFEAGDYKTASDKGRKCVQLSLEDFVTDMRTLSLVTLRFLKK
jgi:hypothetical protein